MPEVVELPDAGVLALPDPADLVCDLGEPDARLLVQEVAVADIELDRREQVAVGAELQLLAGVVSVAHRPRAPIAGEVARPLRVEAPIRRV